MKETIIEMMNDKSKIESDNEIILNEIVMKTNGEIKTTNNKYY